MMMWFLSPRPCAFLALLPFVLVRCARFRDGELNPTSIKEKWDYRVGAHTTTCQRCHDRFTDRHRTHQRPGAKRSRNVTRRHTHTSPRPYRRRAFRQGTLRQIDLIPPDGINILGAPFPIVVKGRYRNGCPSAPLLLMATFPTPFSLTLTS
eukprot:scaffold153_cov105-Isochrysis_galbana.AAC.8